MVKLKQLYNEIKLVSMIPLEKGKMYDVKVWWDGGIEGGSDYYEPCEGTIDGEEGWYWMLMLIYSGIQNNQYIFYDIYVSEDIGFDMIDITKKDIRPNKEAIKYEIKEVKLLKNPKQDALDFIYNNFSEDEMLEDNMTYEFNINDVPKSIFSYLKYNNDLRINIKKNIIAVLYINGNLVIEFF